MMGTTLAALSVAGLNTAFAQALPDLSTAQIVANVQGFYDKAKTFRADFKQLYTIAAYGKTKKSAGKVVFQKPGRMSWRYTTNGNRVVSDGRTLRVYEEDNQQLFEQSVNKSQYPAALSFLVGSGKLEKSFKFRKMNPRVMKFKGGYILLAIPRDPTPAYQKMLLYVDGATFQVRRVLFVDAQKNRNMFDFEKPRLNEKIAAGEFQFTPPPGTQVVRP